MDISESTSTEVFQKQIIDTLSGIYDSIILVNLSSNKLTKISQNDDISAFFDEEDDAESQIRKFVRKFVSEDHVTSLLKFADFRTLPERIESKKIVRQEFFSRDGHWRRASFIPSEKDPAEQVISVLFCITEIDEEKQSRIDAEKKLKQTLKNQSEMYNEMLQNQSSGIIAYNTKTKKILMMNAASLAIFGWDCVGSDSIEYIHEKIISPKKEQIIQKITSMTLMDDEVSYEFAIKRPEGNYMFVLGHTKVILLSSHEQVTVSSFINITKIKKMERELVTLSSTDGLTKINNRASGEKKIERYLKEGQSGMFCLFDADKFKSINDTYGHGAGDAVLVEIASCLKKSFRKNDVVMRLGGDEFAAFAVGIKDEETGSKLLNGFYENISKIVIPEMKDRKVTVSLGAVLFKHSDEEKETFDGLYQKADTAMYICKHNRGNKFGFYNKEQSL